MTDQAPTKPDPTQCDPTKPDPSTPTSVCKPLPEAPKVPCVPTRDPCTEHCKCPDTPGNDAPSCLVNLIRDQNLIVAKAERAKVYVDELTGIQSKVTSALVDYTDTRYRDLKKKWGELHTAITELVRKVICAVHCWDCLLECRLCRQLVKIRELQEQLDGPGDLAEGMGLPKMVSSFRDQQFWHERNVANMQARVNRIKLVLAAWEKPSDTLGDALDQNAKLVDDIAKIIATDPAKAVYDLFVTLIQRHWAIRPRDVAVGKVYEDFATSYVNICECHEDAATQPAKSQDKATAAQAEDPNQNPNPDPATEPAKCKCDEGTPDDCCGPDAGILSLRQQLIGPLPYIVDPNSFPQIICCLTEHRLTRASDLLASAQAELAAVKTLIEQTTGAIADKKAAIATNFLAGLPTPFDCTPYCKEDPPKQPEKKPEQKPNDTQAAAR